MNSENIDYENIDYDEQEGGMELFGYSFGSKKKDELPKAMTQEVNKNTTIKVRRAPVMSLPKNPLSSRLFERASQDPTLDQLQSEAVFIPVPDEHYKRQYKTSFTDKLLKQFIPKLLLVNRPQNNTKSTALDLEKVTLLRKLCEISLFATKACAKDIFNNVADANLISLDDYNRLITETNDILDKHFDNEFLSQAINTNITNNMRSIAKYPTNFMEVVLRLFVIYYYPRLLLEIIRDKMTNSARVIKEAKGNLSGDSINKFSELVSNISNDQLAVGGGIELLPVPEELAAPFALEEARKRRIEARALMTSEVAKQRAHVNNNENILNNYIIKYTGNNSYVTNSRKVFYNALINFAVSINIDIEDYYKNIIILTLQSKFNEVLEVKDRDEEVNTSMFDTGLTKYQHEYDKALDAFKSLSDLWIKYSGLKDKLTRMQKSYEEFITKNEGNLDNSEMQNTIDEKETAIEGAETRMKNFTDMHEKLGTEESRIIQRYLLSEQKLDAAKNAKRFLITINRAKRDINTETNITKIIEKIWLRNEITIDYIKNVQDNITHGIKESNMFKFTYVNTTQQQAQVEPPTPPLLAQVEPPTPPQAQVRLGMPPQPQVQVQAQVEPPTPPQAQVEPPTPPPAAAAAAAAPSWLDDALGAAKRSFPGLVTNAALNIHRANEAQKRQPPVNVWVPNVSGNPLEAGGGALGAARTIRGKRITRRHKKRAGTRRYKKRAGTRRHKKRSGTHRKRKNTTR